MQQIEFTNTQIEFYVIYVSTWNLYPSFYHPPPLRVPPAAAASVAASTTRPLSAPPPPPPPAADSVAAVSAAAMIAVSTDIAAAFWLIVVRPRCCLCFRLPSPFFPSPAVATAAVCRRHYQCCRHRHRRPCSFCLHRCRRRRRRPPPCPSPPSSLPPRSPFPLKLLLLSG